MQKKDLQIKITKEITSAFAEDTINIFAGLLQVNGKTIGTPTTEDSFKSKKNIFISIYFTGIVYGEFILAIDEKTALECIHSNELHDSEHDKNGDTTNIYQYDALSEALNIIVGTTLKKLSFYFDKLTMTAPRVYFGQIVYPKFTTGIQTIQLASGEIECHFYYDQMQLDLAVSYQDTLQSLISTNRTLNQVNEKLKEQQAQLVQSEKMASLGMMAAGVAHEINNPLAYVDSNISTLEDYSNIAHALLSTHERLVKSFIKKDERKLEKSLDEIDKIKKKDDLSRILEDTREIFEETRFGIKRIKDIVLGLKKFSHIDHEVFKSVDINDEIENMLKLVANQLKYKCTVIRNFELKDEVSCFPGQLNQVFVNLLVNAAQAMPENGGIIEINTKAKDSNTIMISFKDNGCGISAENLKKIFDPFFSTKPVGEGTGLGLSISYSIIKKHNGSINVESTLGKGTTFTVTLPMRQKYEDCKNTEE